MRLVVLIMIANLLANNFIAAQVTLTKEQYDKLNEEKTELKTGLAAWKSEAQRLRKDSIQFENDKVNILAKHKKDTTSKNKEIAGVNTQLKKTKDDLQEAQLQLADLKLCKEQNTKYRADSAKAEKDIEKLKMSGRKDSAQIKTLGEEVNHLKEEIAVIPKLKKDYSDLSSANANLDAVLQKRQQSIDSLKNELAKGESMQKENKNLKGFILPGLEKDINELIQGTTYKPESADVLDAKCREIEPLLEDKKSVATLRQKLSGYKKMSEQIIEAEIVLAAPYDKSRCEKAKDNLDPAAPAAVTDAQRGDLARYKQLLSDYCKVSASCFKEISFAKSNIAADGRDYAEKALDKKLKDINQNNYPFLYNEMLRLKLLVLTIKGNLITESKIKDVPCQ